MIADYDENWDGHDLVYSTLGVPPEAMIILGYVPDIPINDFKDEHGLIINNRGRTVDVSDHDIANWTKLHEAGKYNDKIHCPPTFKTHLVYKKAIVTGTSKTKGADGADNVNTIGAVEVEFHDFEGVSAKAWEEIARSNENRPLEERDDYIKNDRKDEDVIGTLVNLYHAGELEVQKRLADGSMQEYNTDLNKKLRLLKIPESQWPKWRNQFYEKMRINIGQIVRTASKSTKEKKKFKDEVEKLFPGKKIFHKTLESGNSGNIKYGIETIREILDARLEGKPYDMAVFYLTRIGTPENLEQWRKVFRKFFTDPNQHFQKDLKRTESKISNKEKWPEVFFEPQTEHELIEWKKKGDTLL